MLLQFMSLWCFTNHDYFLPVIFLILQVLALAYYTTSYFPGGSSGLKIFSSILLSTVPDVMTPSFC
ncbi:unnamed protein product [Triticum turgidum subsp. durum]|uniref:Vesicle transport protein n=1 Tax=Triticum turgidum subsp. durum TaxID=4567 RepID=A0A9R0V9A3_TRITD|nr:unnamed protein product [Triticum turgidum subsp. durum]